MQKAVCTFTVLSILLEQSLSTVGASTDETLKQIFSSIPKSGGIGGKEVGSLDGLLQGSGSSANTGGSQIDAIKGQLVNSGNTGSDPSSFTNQLPPDANSAVKAANNLGNGNNPVDSGNLNPLDPNSNPLNQGGNTNPLDPNSNPFNQGNSNPLNPGNSNPLDPTSNLNPLNPNPLNPSNPITDPRSLVSSPGSNTAGSNAVASRFTNPRFGGSNTGGSVSSNSGSLQNQNFRRPHQFSDSGTGQASVVQRSAAAGSAQSQPVVLNDPGFVIPGSGVFGSPSG